MKISVIIPVYNVEQYLEQCINSIIKQTYSNLEILLVNDGSTDSSGKVCDELASNDSRVKVIHQINGGVSSARNTGMDAASGDYITFVDSDDWLEAGMYQNMIGIVSKQNAPDIVMCDFISEKENNIECITACIRKGYYNKADIIRELYPTLLVKEDLGRLPIVSACICLFKKEFLHVNQIKFEVSLKYSEDYLFMALVMIRADSFYYLKNNYYYHYRQYNLSRSKKYQLVWWDNLLLLNDKLNYLLSGNVDYDFTRQIKFQLVHSALFLSSAIFQNYSLNTRKKILLLKNLFNDSALKSSFYHLCFKNKPLGLKIVLYLVKYKLATGYWIFRSLNK